MFDDSKTDQTQSITHQNKQKIITQSGWKPSLNISTVLTSIMLLMAEPNPDDGLMAEIVSFFPLFFFFLTHTSFNFQIQNPDRRIQKQSISFSSEGKKLNSQVRNGEFLGNSNYNNIVTNFFFK